MILEKGDEDERQGQQGARRRYSGGQGEVQTGASWSSVTGHRSGAGKYDGFADEHAREDRKFDKWIQEEREREARLMTQTVMHTPCNRDRLTDCPRTPHPQTDCDEDNKVKLTLTLDGSMFNS